MNCAFVRRFFSLLERAKRTLDKPPQQPPETINPGPKVDIKPENIPFLVSNTPEIRMHPEFVAYWQQNQERDAVHQRKMLCVQWALFWTTLAAFFAAAYYAYVATEQFGTMQRQLEATDRPWIKIMSVKLREDFTFFLTEDSTRERNWKTLANETIDIVAKNIGHSVAQNVVVKGRMPFTEGIEKLMEERNFACSGSLPYVFSVNLFPDEDTGNSQFIIGTEIVPSREKSKPPVIGGGEVPWNLPADTWIASPKFVGCFTYTIANTGAIHYTGFIYEMTQKVSYAPILKGTGYDARFFKVGEDVSKDKLSIVPDIAGFDLN